MTDERPQPPQDEQAVVEVLVEEPDGNTEAVTDAGQQPDGDAPIDLDKLSYAEYLKLTNPGKSDEEIARMIRKENRYTWMVRFQLLAFVLIVIGIIVLIISN